jgi:hypothetical protein
MNWGTTTNAQLLAKYNATIYKHDWRNEKSASRIVYSGRRNKNSDTRII